VIPLDDPLGPAVMLLLLDECPLPTKELIAEFLANYPLNKSFSQSGQSDPQTHRNLCVILSCLAEKLAGALSTSLLMHCSRDGGVNSDNGDHRDDDASGRFKMETFSSTLFSLPALVAILPPRHSLTNQPPPSWTRRLWGIC